MCYIWLLFNASFILFIRSFYSFVHSFIHSFIYSLTFRPATSRFRFVRFDGFVFDRLGTADQRIYQHERTAFALSNSETDDYWVSWYISESLLHVLCISSIGFLNEINIHCTLYTYSLIADVILLMHLIYICGFDFSGAFLRGIPFGLQHSRFWASRGSCFERSSSQFARRRSALSGMYAKPVAWSCLMF